MSNIKLLSVDMDGTLLNSDLEISNKNLIALRKLIDNDMQIVFSTGRTFKASYYYSKKYNIKAHIICYNGGLVKEADSENFLYSSKMNIEAAKEILYIADMFDIYTKVYIDDVLYVKEESIEAKEFSMTNRIPYKCVGKLYKFIDKEPNMIVFIDDLPKMNVIKAAVESKFYDLITVTSSSLKGLELISYGNSKKNSLEILCNKLGIKNSEVISIGNGLNDLEMLEWSEIGVAVKNSDPQLLKKVKEVSDYTNDENAVYHILKKYNII
ncbi:HAD family hydrolase [Thermoanaerobacterium thermosaccharolyticum]|uniref:HAD family hydrolase n=1 Tax=Thermoanaerobacterium thermosaccharolyticum TaxID=1517 RepID=UPI003DA8A697